MIFSISYGTIAILPKFLQSLLGYTSFLSGIAAAPMGVGTVMGVIIATLIAKIDLRIQTFAGVIIFSLGCYLFSNLNLDIAMGNIVLPNIVLGIGMITVIIPITTIIYSYVSKQETTNASSLQNLVKNVGCAVGTSSAGFLVSRYAQIHQSYLVDRLTVLNSAFAEKISTMTATFMQHGHDIFTAQQMAQSNIYNQLLQQSTLCAYMTSYKVYAAAVIIILPLVLI